MKNLLSVILLFFITSLVYAQESEYKTKLNIPYYDELTTQSNEYIKERCLLDVYYPTNIKGFTTVVWFHGGGITGGEKHISEELKNKGIAVVAVNYRLNRKVNCPGTTLKMLLPLLPGLLITLQSLVATRQKLLFPVIRQVVTWQVWLAWISGG